MAQGQSTAASRSAAVTEAVRPRSTAHGTATYSRTTLPTQATNNMASLGPPQHGAHGTATDHTIG
jgi:hypothetical protein